MPAATETTKQAFDTLSGALFLTDPRGEVVYANSAMEVRTGFAVGEIVGKRPKDLWGGNMDRSFYEWMWQTIRDKKQPFIAAVENRRKDRSSHREYIHIAPIVGEGREVAYFMELHPRILDDERESRFQNEFRDVFSQQRSDKTATLEWMLPWLGGASALMTSATEPLGTFFFRELIAPTEERYAARSEDGALVLAAQEHPAEFRLLYQKYKDDVHGYFSHRLGRDREAADELTQETFLRAFRYLQSFCSANASYGTYLLRIAHNLFANHFREKSAIALDDVPEASLRSSVETQDLASLLFEKESVWQAVGHLSQIEQQVVTMKYQDDLSVRDIATVLSKSENAVKLHLSRARKRLREMV